MAHGKETPRQKMIGMMYLVLTALLALNVSKDILNAFVVVDEGLTTTIENFSQKNDKIYADFGKAAAQNKNKAGKWNDKANIIKSKAETLYQEIQSLKIEIINKSEGEKNPAVADKKINVANISAKDNTNIPAEIMVGSHDNGKANKLKEDIDNFRNTILSMIDPKAEAVRKSIMESLNTNPPEKQEKGKIETWQGAHFEHLPLVGVITIMSGLQANVRNAETDILRYLYAMIDAGSVKFNKVDATIIQNSNYVIQGNDYEAQIFLAAFDTTQKPKIYIGSYDSVPNEDGNYRYTMRKPYDSITEITNGRGIFKRRASGTGNVKWGGLISIKSTEGGPDVVRTFRSEYRVAEPLLVVSPTKMNVFYTGVDNPVEVSVPGIPGDKVFATVDNGSMVKEGKAWIVRPVRAGIDAHVQVTAEIDKVKKPMGTKLFRVKNVPDPVAKVAGLKSGLIEKQLLAVQAGVAAEMENFDFDLQFKVTSFTVSTSQGGFTLEKESKSNRFTTEQTGLISKATRGQKIYIENIKAIGPDGTTRLLNTIALTIK
jgi:gliding motility-associated protein GldM